MNPSRNKSAKRRPLGVQHLESRGMLAGVVGVSFSGTTLTVTGDSLDNDISLAISGANLEVTGNAGTTISGFSLFPVAGFTILSIKMNQGDDVVTFDPLGVDLTGIDIVANLGPANDADALSATDLIARDLSITGGTGSDAITINGFDGRNLSIQAAGALGAGDQEIELTDLALTGALAVTAGKSSDTAISTLDIDDATVAAATSIVMSGAASETEIDDLTGAALTIRVAADSDVSLGTTTENDLSGALSLTATANATIIVGSIVPNVVDGAATIQVGGNSQVTVNAVEFNSNVSVKSGSGGNSGVSFTGLDIAGRLTITLGNGVNNNVNLTDGNVDGAVSIVTGNADNVVQIGGTAVTMGSAVQITTGNGDNTVYMANTTIDNGAATGAPGLAITTKNGDADITLDTVETEGPITIRAGNAVAFHDVSATDVTTGGSLSIYLGTSAAANDVDLDGADIGLDLIFSSMGGGNDLDILASDIARNLSLTTRSGADAIDVDGTDVLGATNITTGNDNDEVTLGATSASSFAKKVTVVLGNGDDSLTIGAFVDDAAGAFVPGAYLIAFDGGANSDTIDSNLPSLVSNDPLLATKIKNFEIYL